MKPEIKMLYDLILSKLTTPYVIEEISTDTTYGITVECVFVMEDGNEACSYLTLKTTKWTKK